MYAGKLVELGDTLEVFHRPRHPYSYLLLSSTPSITSGRRSSGMVTVSIGWRPGGR